MKALMISAILCLVAIPGGSAAAAQAGAITLKGQVVCSECWFEEKDRRANPYGPSELACAARCSKGGVPQALAVWTGDTATLYLLENGAFKKDEKDFLAYVVKEVEVTGTTRTAEGKQYLKVDDLKVVGDGPAATSDVPAPQIGAAAPELALADLSGQQQTLASYKGKIVVLNFWATWCVPCRKEMPAFVNLQNEYAAWGVQVVAASADTAEAQGQVVKFVREKKLSFPVWLGATTDHMFAFGLGAELPGTVVIDREGNIVARFRGMVKEADLKKEVDKLLEKQHTTHGGASVTKTSKSSVPA